MTPEERAAAIAAQFPANGIQYTYLGIVFAVAGCRASGPTVGLALTAWTGQGAHRVYLPIPAYDTVLGGLACNFLFTNPPLMVPDGGTEVVTPPHGDPYTRPTFARDDLAAAQSIVHSAVTGYALRHGWTP